MHFGCYSNKHGEGGGVNGLGAGHGSWIRLLVGDDGLEIRGLPAFLARGTVSSSGSSLFQIAAIHRRAPVVECMASGGKGEPKCPGECPMVVVVEVVVVVVIVLVVERWLWERERRRGGTTVNGRFEQANSTRWPGSWAVERASGSRRDEAGTVDGS